MNIVERGKAFVQSLRELSERSIWDWRRCPRCGGTNTCKYGSYSRNPWFFGGRQKWRVQRHKCYPCNGTYSEQSALLVRGSWYAREVHRAAIDYWQFAGSSLRRLVELLRAHIDHQGRWLIWRPLDVVPAEEGQCRLSASSVHRWLDVAGKKAEETVVGQLAGVATSGQVGTDGLWARLRGVGKDGKGKAEAVVLALVDSVTGVIWPPIVTAEEGTVLAWASMFRRARRAGLRLNDLRGVVSDGAKGLIGYLNAKLTWVNHQRCVWHIWRQLSGELMARVMEAGAGLSEEPAKVARKAAREELVALVRGVLDATSEGEAKKALDRLGAHPRSKGLAEKLRPHLDALLVYRMKFNAGLARVGPEWIWRDFRLRLSHGRNHGTTQRLERAALVWAIYHNLTPAQWRSERKRHYRYPGRSPLEVAGLEVGGGISYLDALAV